MTEIRFYHLTRARVEEALPMIVGKAHDAHMRMAILSGGDQNRLSYLSDLMWNYVPNSFYANGYKGENDDEGFKDKNPIWISDDAKDIDDRSLLLQLDGAEITVEQINAEQVKKADKTLNRICHFFDGRDETAVQKARTYWKSFKEAGDDFTLSYWQQDDNGRWSQKA